MVAAMCRLPSGARLGDQWHGGGAAATEDERIDGHAIRVVPLRISAGLLVAATVKQALGWRSLGTGFLGDLGRQSLPASRSGGRAAGAWSFSMPSHQTSPSSVKRDVGENHIPVRLAMQLGLVSVFVPGATPK